MSFDKQKLLAYALGELDPKERQQIESFMKANPEAARYVRESQQFSAKVSADLGQEKTLAGKGLAALEQALQKKKIKPELKPSNSQWIEISVVVTLFIAVGIYFRTPLMNLTQRPAPQTNASLDFYQTNLSSISGISDPGKELSAVELKNALTEWKERPRIEENLDDCHFSLPTPTRAELGLTKIATDQKAWFFLLNNGKTQLRLIMNSSDCQIALDVHGNLSAAAQSEVDEELRAQESELQALVERKK